MKGGVRAVPLAFLVLACSACSDQNAPVTGHAQVRMLALGDSYTIGESVPVDDRWPVQLAVLLEEGDAPPVRVEIVARTGWTTAELDAAVDDAALRGTFDLVTLLAGVNDQYRGLAVEGYRERFAALVQRAIGFACGDPSRVIVVSIPDWGVTPFGGGNPVVSAEIDAFNAVNRDEAAAAGVAWVDVTGISRSGDPGLVAGDGLHPSGAQYARWAETLLPAALAALGRG